MNNLLLKGLINANLARTSFLDNLKARREQGGIVEVIIIIAIFVLICVVVGGILYAAITAQANKVSDCISNVNAAANCSSFSK